KKATYVFFANLMLVLCGTLVICTIQNIGVVDVLFECFSAGGTVGMTTGITRELNAVSKLVIIFLMYCGRVGSISFGSALLEKRALPPVTAPVENITIG
ncbi:MAG: Trk family potassium uptake protein, partial [Lachnospiraceae bacterium]|nr:Trk family potassium uptake protein [Lachnospiraceae bacterium]